MIQINQEYAKIGINTERSQISLKITHPKLNLETQKSQLEIESPKPKIHIDQRQCFADFDKRTPEQFTKYYSDLSKSAFLRGIARVASEGDSLAKISQGMDIAQLAANRTDTRVDYNLTAIPKQRPIIEFDIHPVRINYKAARVDINAQAGSIENNFQHGKVDIYIEQMNYLEINWKERQSGVNFSQLG